MGLEVSQNRQSVRRSNRGIDNIMYVDSSKRQFKIIDEYVASFPTNVQVMLQELRQTIRKAAPGAMETISYQIPTFRLNGYLVFFAAFKNHIGFYPMPAAIRAFKKELSRYGTAKGTVRFPLGEPLPLSLISKIVRFRAKENLAKKKNQNNLPPKQDLK